MTQPANPLTPEARVRALERLKAKADFCAEQAHNGVRLD